VIYAEDEDGELLPITQADLVRVWVWQMGKLHSQLVLGADAAAVIESKQREGWHAWATAPLLVVVS
jgi:hypothetical protein